MYLENNITWDNRNKHYIVDNDSQENNPTACLNGLSIAAEPDSDLQTSLKP